MKSRTTAQFRACFAELPTNVQRQARDAYRLFKQNPSHPGLHFKQVNADPPTYSARVGLSYRAVRVLAGDAVVWFGIGSHANYDRLVQQL